MNSVVSPTEVEVVESIRRCGYGLGLLQILVAFAMVPSMVMVVSYAGGSALHGGFEENGHYFVAPGHGKPIVEVSGSLWWRVYWVERLWPWSALVPGLFGLLLTGADRETDAQPRPDTPIPTPRWLLGAGAAVVAITALGGWVGWELTGGTWGIWLGCWLLFCVGAMAIGLDAQRYERSLTNPVSETRPADENNGC